MKKRPLAFSSLVLALLVGCQSANAEPTLTIGDKAPAIDVEKWISLGGDRFKPVTKLENGKVYVIEFWATWCGPCIQSMPHLAELQEKYADKGLQIVSVTDDGEEAIQKLLEKTAPNARGDDKTYADVTGHYILGSDPDQSVQQDYMAATRQSTIPTAYIVGRDGLLEWVGNPAIMDEPLAAVIEGTWDRKTFKDQFEDEQRLIDLDIELNQVAKRLKNPQDRKEFIAAALPVIERYEQAIKTPQVKLNVSGTKLTLVMDLAPGAPATAELFKTILSDSNVSPVFKHDMAWKAYEISMEQDVVNEPLLQAAADAIPKLLPELSQDSHATVLDTLAHLQHRLGNPKEALATAEKALELSGNAPEYEVFIKQLRTELKL